MTPDADQQERLDKAIKNGAIPLEDLGPPRPDAVVRAARYFRYYLALIVASAVFSAAAAVGLVGFAIVYNDNHRQEVCFSKQFANVFIAVGEAFKTSPGTEGRESQSQGIVDAARVIKNHPC